MLLNKNLNLLSLMIKPLPASRPRPLHELDMNIIEIQLGSLPSCTRNWLCKKVGWKGGTPTYFIVRPVEKSPIVFQLEERINV